MLIFGRIEVIALVTTFVLFASFALAQNEEHNLLAQKTILDKDTAVYVISNCTALIVLSKDQCSACSKSIPNLAKKLAKLGYESSFGIVLDKSLMDSKTDEYYLNSVFDPDPPIFFLIDKTVIYKSIYDSNNQSVHLKTTPSLILFNNMGIEVIHSADVVDDYGRSKSLSFLSDVCLSTKQKKPFLQNGFE